MQKEPTKPPQPAGLDEIKGTGRRAWIPPEPTKLRTTTEPPPRFPSTTTKDQAEKNTKASEETPKSTSESDLHANRPAAHGPPPFPHECKTIEVETVHDGPPSLPKSSTFLGFVRNTIGIVVEVIRRKV